MNDETKWMYLMTCPYAKEGGVSLLLPPMTDIRTQSASDVKGYSQTAPFVGQRSQMPFENVTRKKIQKWRPAGFFAQRRTAAACECVVVAKHKCRQGAARGCSAEGMARCLAG